MPFEELETITRDNQPPTALVSYMRSTGRGGVGKTDPAKKPRLSITLPTSICGIGKLKKHQLLIGSGADKGKLRLKGVAAGKAGGVKPSEFKTHFIWRFGYVPKLGDEIFDGERCAVRKIGDDEFEVDINSAWFEPSK